MLLNRIRNTKFWQCYWKTVLKMCLFSYMVNLTRPRVHPFLVLKLPFFALLYIIPNQLFNYNYLSNSNSMFISLKMFFSPSLGWRRGSLACSIFALTSIWTKIELGPLSHPAKTGTDLGRFTVCLK